MQNPDWFYRSDRIADPAEAQRLRQRAIEDVQRIVSGGPECFKALKDKLAFDSELIELVTQKLYPAEDGVRADRPTTTTM